MCHPSNEELFSVSPTLKQKRRIPRFHSWMLPSTQGTIRTKRSCTFSRERHFFQPLSCRVEKQWDREHRRQNEHVRTQRWKWWLLPFIRTKAEIINRVTLCSNNEPIYGSLTTIWHGVWDDFLHHLHQKCGVQNTYLFFFFNYLGNLHTHRGARTYDTEVKSRLLFRQNQPGGPKLHKSFHFPPQAFLGCLIYSEYWNNCFWCYVILFFFF